MQPRGFVRVSRDGRRLEEADGSPFFFAGANCYYLLLRAGAARRAEWQRRARLRKGAAA